MIDVLTFGHSSLGWDEFRHALHQFNVGCVIDVRSSPTSRWPHFRGSQLQARLEKDGVSYVQLGDALGGLPNKGPTDYEARRGTPDFAAGIENVLAIAVRSTPALLCAERDPLQCHRFLLIGRHLHDLPGVQVSHILHNGTLETHEQAEERLMTLHNMSSDLLADRGQRLAESYARQERKMG